MNRATDGRILKIILPGYRIQSEIFNEFADPKIAAVRDFIDFLGPDFFYFAREEVRIVDLNDRQKYVVSGNDYIFFCHRRDFLHVTHQ